MMKAKGKIYCATQSFMKPSPSTGCLRHLIPHRCIIVFQYPVVDDKILFLLMRNGRAGVLPQRLTTFVYLASLYYLMVSVTSMI